MTSNKKILFFKQDTGEFIRSIETDSNNIALKVTSDNRIFFASEKKVYQLEANTPKEILSFSNTKTIISDIAVTSHFIYVADIKQKLLYCYKNNVLQFISNGKHPNEKRGFYLPTPHFQLAIGKNNSVWVNNPGKLRLENYDTKGRLIKKWGRPGTRLSHFSGCCNPVNFNITKNGEFITFEKGLVRVKHYTKNGKFIDAVTGIKHLNQSLINLPIATKNNKIFLFNSHKKTILIFKKRDKR
jgi:hypothetical protein